MAEIEFELFNNQLVQQLVGPQDGNLKIIEKALGAEIAAFGNRIRISGDEEAVRQAKNAVDALYSKVSRGIAVGEQEVLAAVRISGAEANVKPQVNIDDIVLKTKKRHIYPRSATQAEYIVEMMNNELVFGLGPAGTGKTYLAVALAVTMMLEGSIDKIILSRPAVEAGENLGFLPGDLKDKVDPYLRPLYDALYEMLPAEQVDKKLAAGEIEIAPLAFMRGRTLSNAFVILDEAQNTTPMQMKMFLTRLGENSRMVVNGDLSQVDLPRGVVSGLRDALDTLRGVGGISSVTFSAADVVRHGLVAKIVRAYEQKYHREEKKKDDFFAAPSGIIGLETALALGITQLVKPGHLTLMQLMEKMSLNPARLYHLDGGTIAEGHPADLVLFHPDETFVCGNYQSKAENTPFTRWELYGKVHATICGGKIVWRG